IIRRSNAAARVNSNRIILAGVSDESHDAMIERFDPALLQCMTRVKGRADLDRLLAYRPPLRQPPIAWGRDRIGVGLLKALRARSDIAFFDHPSPEDHVETKSNHLVICEDRDELAQVIAANYAFSLGAGFQLIAAIDDEAAKDILERFYSVMDRAHTSPSE